MASAPRSNQKMSTWGGPKSENFWQDFVHCFKFTKVFGSASQGTHSPFLAPPALPCASKPPGADDAPPPYGSVAMRAGRETVSDSTPAAEGAFRPPAAPPPQAAQGSAKAKTSRFVMVFHCFLSFVICNIDRINLSVAIIPMAKIFGWTESTKGLVQCVFFVGYMTTQIAGGLVADARGGRPVLAAGVFAWSMSTLLTPLAAHIAMPVLLLARIVLGVGEGVAMPAMNAIVAAWVPVTERARSLSFVYSGMYAGSILGLVTAPWLIEAAGWPAVFYVFGGVGIVWVALFWLTTTSAPHLVPQRGEHGYKPVPEGSLTNDIEVFEASDGYDSSNPLARTGLNRIGRSILEVEEGHQTLPPEKQWPNPTPPVRDLLGRKCVWAIIVAHFCCTWGYFVLLTWLPSYIYQRFDLDVKASALLAATPWVAMFIFANVGGVLADLLIRYNWSVTTTRKLMQSIGFLGPAIFLGAMCSAKTAGVAMFYVSTALALASFSQSGVYANHQDIGPQVAGTLLGISNTFASLPGVIGVYITGVVLDATGNNWNVVFGIAIMFYCIGFVGYNMFATSERQW